jgi:hypothetical protein
MKKHKALSVFIIVGVVLLILGIITTSVGFITGGTINFQELRNRGYFRYTREENHNNDNPRNKDLENIDYNITSEIVAIDIEVAVADIEIIPNADNARVEVRNYRKDILKISEANGTLILKDAKDYKTYYDDFSPTIKVYIVGNSFNLVDIDLDVGNITISGMTASEADIDIEVGDIKVSGSTFTDLNCSSATGNVTINDTTAAVLELDADVGDIVFSGDVTREADISSDVGNVTLNLGSAESNYYFELSVDIGEVSINDIHMSGLGRHITHGQPNAPVKIEVKSSLGDVDITTK